MKITNPYQDVIWAGEGAWGAYLANLHTHTVFSDAPLDLKSSVEEYYRRGYDVLATADHGVVSKPWDKRPRTVPPFHWPNLFRSHEILSSQRLREIAEGAGRGGRGMTQVPRAIEINCATLYKNHVVGLFAGWGQGRVGWNNDFRRPVKYTQKRGGVTIIAHPGDWIKSKFNRAAAEDPANINFFADILRKYPSCLGMEAYNSSDSPTRHDRVLWDELLKRLMPEGRQVFGFANDDSHFMRDIGNTAEMLFMPSNTVENIRTCLETGAFLACSRYDRVRLDENQRDLDQPFPGVSSITIEGETITVTPTGTDAPVEWIADGKLIHTGVSINLAEHADKITCYVRAQLVGPGGISSTQAFGVDKGTSYRHPDDGPRGWALAKWYVKLYLTKNAFAWIAEMVKGLFR